MGSFKMFSANCAVSSIHVKSHTDSMFDYYALNILEKGGERLKKIFSNISLWSYLCPDPGLLMWKSCVSQRKNGCLRSRKAPKGPRRDWTDAKTLLHHPENEHVPSGSALLFEGNKAWHIFGREKMCFVIVFTRPLMPDSRLITTMSSTAGAQTARDPPSPSTWFSPQRFAAWPHAAAAAANHTPFTRRRKDGEQSRPLMAALFGGRRRALRKKKKESRPF